MLAWAGWCPASHDLFGISPAVLALTPHKYSHAAAPLQIQLNVYSPIACRCDLKMNYEIGPFSVHSDFDAYLRELDRVDRYPVLTGSADQLKPVVDSISWRASSREVLRPDLLVMTPESSPIKPVARALAERYSADLRSFGDIGLSDA